MNYTVRCTHCLMLLKNLKKYAKAHFENYCEELYIDVEDEEEADIINSMEMHISITLKRYRELEDITSKKKKS